MSTMNDNVDSFVGLDYKTVRRLIKESCERIDRMANTLLVLERGGMTLCKAYCDEYELLLLERLDMCRKLNEFYTENRKKSFWPFRCLIDRNIIKVAQLHKETLLKLMALRNYVRLNF